MAGADEGGNENCQILLGACKIEGAPGSVELGRNSNSFMCDLVILFANIQYTVSFIDMSPFCNCATSSYRVILAP